VAPCQRLSRILLASRWQGLSAIGTTFWQGTCYRSHHGRSESHPRGILAEFIDHFNDERPDRSPAGRHTRHHGYRTPMS
jgi:hypothetical protein